MEVNMTKTDTALRNELEDLKNDFYNLSRKINVEQTVKIAKLEQENARQSKRTDRIVQVLLNNLPEEQLSSKVVFSGRDSNGNHRYWGSGFGYTLREFLQQIIDP
jgi:hypothetical protein